MSHPALDAARDQLAALAGGTLDVGRYGTASRAAAVLILFGPRAAGDLDVLLEARAPTLSAHPGQVSFPGGRAEPADAGPADTALRESVEETGLDPSGVDVLGTLTPIPLAVSDHLVTPVLAWWRVPSPVHAVDDGESSLVFRAPIADLTDPANRRTALVRRGRTVHRSPAFLIEAAGVEHLVWGFTGIILGTLLDRLGWSRPWDPSRTVDPLGIVPSRAEHPGGVEDGVR